jgi:hypothetical protein
LHSRAQIIQFSATPDDRYASQAVNGEFADEVILGMLATDWADGRTP